MKNRFIVCGIVSVFLIFSFAGFAMAANDNVLGSSLKDDQWNYFQEIIVNETAGKILTDYPVPVGLNSSNFNFSKAKGDGSDIRFFSENRTLNYWIETWNFKNQEATIWVKVPSIPANEASKILMKYGNSEAMTASNGKKTFDFFDNFDGNTLSSLDWNAEGTEGGTVKVENGICKVLAPIIHAYDSSTIYSRGSFDINSMFVIRRMKVTTGADNRGPLLRQGFIDRIESRKNEIRHETEFANESRVSWETVYKDQKHDPYDLTDAPAPEGNWYVSGIAWFEENHTRKITWFKDGIRDSKMDYASNEFITNSPMHIYLHAASNPDSLNNTGYMAVDYVLVRKFVGTEPTVNVVSNQTGSNASIEKNASIENISGSTVTSQPDLNNKTFTPGEVSQVQKNQGENKAGTLDTGFPKYNVSISGIKLSSPYRFDFPTLAKELDSSGINIIFLGVDIKDVWQYERFVKMAHEKGFAVHAVLLEDFNCSETGTSNACEDSLNAVLDYNIKSLAPFDGIDVFIKPSDKEGSENTSDYSTLFEAVRQKTGKNISLSASIPPLYPASKIENISPFVDFFVVRAYCGGIEGLNSASTIIDAVALQMSEIRGAGSKGLIEVCADKGFEDKNSIQELFADLADYYSNDPAFMGVSIYNYDTYVSLPAKADPNKKESQIPGLPELPGLPRLPGFSVLSVLIVFFGVFALLKVKEK